MFWGEDSLIPQPHDVREFIQHLGYFIGIAEKPQFGRWSYWEKFDYFAVFWGVSIIGMSGLTVIAVRKNIISVKGLDMIDGTPILDIKPYR